MKMPEWIKPLCIGAGIGAAALALVGFTAGGWMTSDKARIVADNEARSQVTQALTPICLQQANNDPMKAQKIAALKEAQSYKRNEMVMQNGWATMPGSDDPNRVVAGACMDRLETQF